jgi:chromosome segregation ATPase
MAERNANRAPKISAEPDEVTGYRRPGGRPRAERGGSSGVGTNVILTALAACLAAAGWFIVVQHQQLSKAEASLTQDDRRLAVLEERLQVTDQVMSQSGTEVQSKLGAWETEFRKLADATKRDRQSIADAQAKLKEHDAVIEAAQATIKELKSSDLRQEQALAQQTAIAQQLATVDQQVRQLVAQQRQVTEQASAMRQSVTNLEAGMARTDKAIQAIDAYRAQLNSRLVEIQSRVDTLSPPPAR